MEYVDIYDEGMNCLGKLPKAQAHQTGAWHKSIHCWIVRKDNDGEYVVFQKRSPHKKAFPNFLDISAAGHYQTGEKIQDGVREIVEELGIPVSFDSLCYLGIKFDVYKDNSIFNREFCETFLYRDDRELSEYPIDCVEVTGLAQISIQDGLDLFSGRRSEITVNGVEYNENTSLIEPITICVNKSLFINRIDQYYGKVFMLAKLFFTGERDLFI